MLVAEMRSALNAGNVGKGMSELPETMPPWAVRHVFERRNGLHLTPIPHEVRALSSIQRAKAIVQEQEARKKAAVTNESDRDLARLRLAVASLL
jgi:hypothetical protein